MTAEPGFPTIDQLKVLLAVVETGSFTAAARRLKRAVSAISYAIATLEQHHHAFAAVLEQAHDAVEFHLQRPQLVFVTVAVAVVALARFLLVHVRMMPWFMAPRPATGGP